MRADTCHMACRMIWGGHVPWGRRSFSWSEEAELKLHTCTKLGNVMLEDDKCQA